MSLLPKPYPDEVIGSVIARGCQQSGLPLKRLLSGVFGSQRSYYSFLMTSDPQRIGALSGTDAEQVLLKHTVFPYAVAFMQRDVQIALWSKAMGAGGQTCVSSLTKNVSHGVPFFRLCPACVKEDMAAFGESYWRRSHLLPCALVCLKHGTRLHTTSIQLRGKAHSTNVLLPHMIAPADTSKAMSGRISEGPLYTLSVKSSLALNGKLEIGAEWRHTYRAKAIRLGYQLPSGDVAGVALARAVRSSFGPEFLAAAGCDYSIGARNPWPALMVRAGTDLTFATPKHVLLGALFDAGIGAAPHITATYEVPGLRRRDYARMDTRAAAKVLTNIKRVRERNERVTIKELLSSAGVWATFRHQRHLFPRTATLLQEFRCSNQAERQSGGRPYWRERQAARFGSTSGGAIDGDDESAPEARV